MSAPSGDLAEVLRVARALEWEDGKTLDRATLTRLAELVLSVDPVDVAHEAAVTPPDGDGSSQGPGSSSSALRFTWYAPDGWLRRGLRGIDRLASPQAVAAVVGLAALTGSYLAVGSWAAAGLAALIALGAWWWWWSTTSSRSGSVPSQLVAREGESDGAAADSDRTLEPPGADDELALEPLLLPRWTRGILTASLAIEKNDGPLDLDRLVDDMARLELPATFPRRVRRTLDRGVVVLVDVSDGMLPLDCDTREILDRIRVTVGPDTIVLYFDGDPLAALGWLDQPEGPEAIQTRRTVLAITNFGLFGPPLRPRGSELEQQWLALAAILRHSRCPFVALVPAPLRQLPPALRREIAMIEWDRSTTAAVASRAVGR